jgi:5-methylcytosine-specific restriction endonuclease McrA
MNMADSPGALHIVIGGVGNDDKDWLDRALRRKLSARAWVVPKSAQIGDDVVIYIPGYGLYATGRVCSSPVPKRGWKHRYGAKIDKLKPIRPAVSLAIIQQELPTLKWANYPRSITTPVKRVAHRLRALIEQRRCKGVGVPSMKLLNRLSLEEHRALAVASASGSVGAKKIRASSRSRSQRIRSYVLRRADGTCEGCGHVGPFMADGAPYLEPHHTIRLADKGPDHPSSIIALCPNCHRRAHSSDDKEHFNKRLKRALLKIVNAQG